MRSNEASGCLTRVVIDGTHDIELEEIQAVMGRIQRAPRYIVPRSHQAHVGNALLNLSWRARIPNHDQPKWHPT